MTDNPFLEIEAAGAFSARTLARYCHLVLAAQGKKPLLAFVCEAENEINTIHRRVEVERGRARGWETFQAMAREFLDSLRTGL